MYVGESSETEPISSAWINIAIHSHTGKTRGNFEDLSYLGIHLKVGNGTPEIRRWEGVKKYKILSCVLQQKKRKVGGRGGQLD